MALTLSVELLTDCYEASLGGGEAEWPPHPARAFCALVAAAEPSSPDDDALRWLEGQEPPQLLVPERTGGSDRSAFVPTNMTTGKGGHQVYVGRTSGARSWSRTVPSARVAHVVWPHAHPEPATVAALDRLARRVGYLGRSTGPVLLSVAAAEPPADGFVVHHADGAGDMRLRVPYRGYLDRLRDAHMAGDAPWSVARSSGYRVAGTDEPPVPAPPPSTPAYGDLLVFAFAPGEGIDGMHSPAVARAFKAAVLQRLGQPLPDVDRWEPFDEARLALLHGHHDGTLRQCAFLSLPFVGHPHATGQVLGVGVALSPDLEPAVRRALLQLAGLDLEDARPRLDRLRVPGLGRRCHLLPADDRSTVDAGRWCATDSTWVTVLPIVLDLFPKSRLPAAEIVARGCEMAGYPRPAEVVILDAPSFGGCPYVPRRVMMRRPGDPLPPAVHARISFDRRVPGPVVVGHLRHLGLGLCLPEGAR